ncbi:ABC-2 type transport system permease protein [Melghiribacillus thermohalophilus]|uniref:ABC-2 type transport system permease protein n=1 Tax=Melghiribacillus thermohalophilus TaxID=1324956 RepID=A0A4R3N748_9BACI|nr:ABC transporter permease [Melghiribacillus thermohalophilus]TCT24945.1 ABC-2 type transport system permease protein [Melghiribacillus thermohalophilus]
MSEYFKLLYNELFKIYVRKSTWAMYAVLTLLIIAPAVLILSFDDMQKEYTDNWREELQKENEEYQKDMAEMEESPGDFVEEYNSQTIAKNNYYLENDIKPLNYGAWTFTLENAGLVSVVSLLTIIIGAGIISNEYRWGTIKLLLIRPISRTKILLSKLTSVFLFALCTMIFLFLISLLTGAIFFGFEGMNPYYVVQTAEGFEHVRIVNEIFSEYGYKVVNLVMMTTLAFMISTIFKNSSLAIGIGIFLLLGGNMVVGIFSQYEWAKYILFANIDLKQYETGNVWIEGMTLGFSITMLMIYFVVFVVLSWLVFNKRDVAGH